MNKRLITYLLASAAVVAALATAGMASASPATKASASAHKQPVVPIVMADPGCHWFRVAGKNSTRLVVAGATEFRNLDEATLVFKGKGFLQHLAVGKTLAVSTPGVYHVTMVGQAPDDNHLVLVVK